MKGSEKSCRIGIKAVPNASRDQIAGWLGEDLKIRVQAPPEDGRANMRLSQFLAGQLGLPKDAVTVVAGHSGPRKTAEIVGLTLEEFKDRVRSMGSTEVVNSSQKFDPRMTHDVRGSHLWERKHVKSC